MPSKVLFDPRWDSERPELIFRCPGCKTWHSVPVNVSRREENKNWAWNKSVEKPTITPSINISGGVRTLYRCHTFVTDGNIQYLGDCTHELAGQTVELPNIRWKLPVPEPKPDEPL